MIRKIILNYFLTNLFFLDLNKSTIQNYLEILSCGGGGRDTKVCSLWGKNLLTGLVTVLYKHLVNAEMRRNIKRWQYCEHSQRVCCMCIGLMAIKLQTGFRSSRDNCKKTKRGRREGGRAYLALCWFNKRNTLANIRTAKTRKRQKFNVAYRTPVIYKN
jgi:hypothetical protein